MAKKDQYITLVPGENPPSTTTTLPKTPAPVKRVQKPERDVAELPVQKPGAGAPALTQTMSVNPNQWNTAADASAASAAPDNYVSQNQQVWGEGGTGKEGYKQVLKQERQYQSQTGSGSNAYSDEDLSKQLIAAGIDPSLLNEDSHKGGWTQNRDTAIAGGGTGEKDESFYLPGDWYYYEGNARPVKEGYAGADEQFLSDGSLAYIQYCQEKYAEAKEANDTAKMAYWHEEAERTRASANYSGGADGSMYIPLGALGVQTGSKPGLQLGAGTLTGVAGGAYGSGFGSTSNTTPGESAETEIKGLDPIQTEQLKALLDEWKAAAEEQANSQIDFATQQAITQLERALQDAQPQFKEQAEAVSIDERQAMDNAALYAQLRGDQGGIGQEQYSSIQNTAAQNRLAVQQAQTKLSTDTARQIEDLRAQGEFEKADKALEITQNYLAQLIGLEQWALEVNLSVDQFNIQLQQWQKEYDMAMQELLMGQSRWEQEFAFQQEQAAISNQQWQQQFDAALDQWRQEFGLSQQQFQAALDQWNQEFAFDQQQAAKETTGGTDPSTIYQALFGAGYTQDDDPTDIANYLIVRGFDSKTAEAYASQFATRGYTEASEAEGWGKGIPEWENFFGVIRQYAMGGNTAKVDEMMSQYGGMMTAQQWNSLQKFFDSIGFNAMGTK